jgi:hypothetical protein
MFRIEGSFERARRRPMNLCETVAVSCPAEAKGM